MQQYFAKDKNLNLTDSDYHHIKNVMRMKIGDTIKVVYDNIVYDCMISDMSNDVKFDVLSKEKKDNEGVKVSVAFSLIKEQKLDFLLQKSAELGAYELLPFVSQRSVVKIDSKKKESKILRWQKILKEASEQSFRSFIPKISNVLDENELLKLDYDLKIVCSLNKNAKSIKKVLQNVTNCDRILLVVGPEGGLSDKEEELFVQNGFVLASLGNNVLRAETAPIVALSMINYEYLR